MDQFSSTCIIHRKASESSLRGVAYVRRNLSWVEQLSCIDILHLSTSQIRPD